MSTRNHVSEVKLDQLIMMGIQEYQKELKLALQSLLINGPGSGIEA